jgi:hypothetical protein
MLFSSSVVGGTNSSAEVHRDFTRHLAPRRLSVLRLREFIPRGRVPLKFVGVYRIKLALLFGSNAI